MCTHMYAESVAKHVHQTANMLSIKNTSMLMISASGNLSAVKMKLQSYCDTSYSRYGGNQMWILKNSNDLLEYILYRFLFSCNSQTANMLSIKNTSMLMISASGNFLVESDCFFTQ
jgi:hypothetical protein